MEKVLDVLSSPTDLRTASSKPSLSRAKVWTGQCAEGLVLLFLLAACIPPVLLLRRSLTIVPFFNLVDESWVVDICYKAANGIWLGRDVVFTYGPLYEWLSSAPSRWIGISTGSILATSSMLPTLVSVVAIFVGLRLLLPEVNPWKRALLLAVVFWSPPGIRLAVCLFAFLVFVRLTDAVAARGAGLVLSGLGAAAICFASFLVSADAGLYCVAALLLCTAATIVVKRKTPGAGTRLCALLVAAGICLTILVVAADAAIASPFNLSQWKSSLILATSYRWFEAKSITLASTWRIFGVLALGSVVFGAAWLHREPEGNHWTLRPAFLLSGFCLALLMMQSGLVRSDAVHIVNGIYPMVFLSGAILFGELTTVRWLSGMLLVGFVVMAVLILVPHAESLPIRALKGAQELFRPNLTCPEGKQEFDHACFPPSDAQLFAAVSSYVDDHTRPGDPIAVFPYQNAFGVMARRTVAGGVLQGYLANGDYLTELDLEGLRTDRPPFALYLPDEGAASYALDSVSNFTRSPGVWFYLLRHYRSAGSPVPGIVGLVRDDERDQHLFFTQEKLVDALGAVRVTKPKTSVDLGPVRLPAAEVDFLKFRLRVNYPFWWKMRKPSAVALWMFFADGSRRLTRLVIEPNRDSEVWVYPWDAQEMGRYFSSEDSRPNGSAITGLRLTVAPFDWISVLPESFDIGTVEAVQVRMK